MKRERDLSDPRGASNFKLDENVLKESKLKTNKGKGLKLIEQWSLKFLSLCFTFGIFD